MEAVKETESVAELRGINNDKKKQKSVRKMSKAGYTAIPSRVWVGRGSDKKG